MTLVPYGQSLAAFRQNDESEEQIDLSRISLEDFFKNDIIRTRITGTIPNLPNLSLSNFVESILAGIQAEDVDFGDCDFKDTLIKETSFRRCSFENATFATSFLADCEFIECRFYYAAAHSAEFFRVKFIDCDLQSVLMKSSKFVDCVFQSCKTNNKLMEMSTLDNSKFILTDIQLQTVTGNFGLISTDLVDAIVRSGRIRESHKTLSHDDIRAELGNSRWSALEKLRIEYFLAYDLRNGSDYLDQALDLTRWTRTYKNPGSFIELLEGFSEFLVSLYTNDRLTVHTILLLHYVTAVLTEVLPREDDLQRVRMSLSGTHMILSRIVEEYLDALHVLTSGLPDTVTFLVEGPMDKEFFQKELYPWFDAESMQIAFLIEHNSPLELGITASEAVVLIPLVAAFLSTRTKFEIIRLRDKPLENERRLRKTKKGMRLPPVPSPKEALFSLEMGKRDDPARYELKVRAVFGSALVDFRLQVGTKFAGKVRKIMLDLLS
jgi:uncharacterized protein YjbI with pentapeptide repeats